MKAVSVVSVLSEITSCGLATDHRSDWDTYPFKYPRCSTHARNAKRALTRLKI